MLARTPERCQVWVPEQPRICVSAIAVVVVAAAAGWPALAGRQVEQVLLRVSLRSELLWKT